jgi:uncharacterized protein YegP (UPF0339 family)
MLPASRPFLWETTMRFELYRDAGGQWRWRLRARNGEVVAESGEGYVRREDCEHGISLVRQSAEAKTVDMTAQIA